MDHYDMEYRKELQAEIATLKQKLEKAQADLKDEMAVSNARRHTSDNLADALEVARRENARLKGLVAIDAMLKMHEDMMQLREEICERAKERDVALLQVRAMQEIVDAAMNENMPRLRAATKAYQQVAVKRLSDLPEVKAAAAAVDLRAAEKRNNVVAAHCDGLKCGMKDELCTCPCAYCVAVKEF